MGAPSDYQDSIFNTLTYTPPTGIKIKHYIDFEILYAEHGIHIKEYK
jgi:hypothetical protein